MEVCLRVLFLWDILPSGRFSALHCSALYLQGAGPCRLPFSASHFSGFSAEYGPWEDCGGKKGGARVFLPFPLCLGQRHQ